MACKEKPVVPRKPNRDTIRRWNARSSYENGSPASENSNLQSRFIVEDDAEADLLRDNHDYESYETPRPFNESTLQFRVTTDHNAEHDQELSVWAGDIIEVREDKKHGTDGWMYGQCRGYAGWVPMYSLMPWDGETTSPSNMKFKKDFDGSQDHTRTWEKSRLTHIYNLVDSEDEFVKELRKFEQEVLKPLKDRKYPQKEMQRINSNWEEIFNASNSLLSALKRSEQETRVEPQMWKIGEVLVTMMPKEKAWLAYSNVKKDILSLLKEQPTSKQALQFQNLEDRVTKLKQLQHIQEYPNLIHEILLNTPLDHPDYKHLKDAHVKAQQNYQQVSISMEAIRSVEELQHIEDMVTFTNTANKFSLVSGTRCLGPRKLIHTGVLQQIKHGKATPCIVFLFNDLLLLVRPTKLMQNLSSACYMDSRTKVNCQACEPMMFLNMLEVMDRVVDDPTVITLLYLDKLEVSSFNLKAANPRDREVWITKIEESSNQYVEALRELSQSQNTQEAKASMRLYAAKYHFSTDDPQALTFIKRDVIKVALKQEGASPGWWFGRSRGKSGWFPKAYVTAYQDVIEEQAEDTPPVPPKREGSLHRQVPGRIPADRGESVTASTEGVESRRWSMAELKSSLGSKIDKRHTTF